MSETSLGALATSGALAIGDGYRTKKIELATEGYRIIRVADIRDGRIALESPDFVSHRYERQIGTKVATAGDVLLTTKGTVGRVAIVPDSVSQAVYSPQLCWLRVKDPEVINGRYLSYWLQSSAFTAQSSHMQGNTDMAPYISLSDLRSAKITLPPLPEQKGISEVLGSLDDMIAGNNSLVSATRAYALTRSRVTTTSTALSDVVTHRTRQLQPATLADSPVDHFSLPAFDSGAGPERVSAAKIMSAKFLIEGSVLLVSKLNPRIPRIWPVDETDSGVPRLASTEFLVLEPSACTPNVLWALLSQPEFISALEGQAAGTSGSHQRVKASDLLATPVPDPRLMRPQVLADIDTALAPVSALIAENRTLAALRDALLPQLMSGKLRVRDAEGAVGDVL